MSSPKQWHKVESLPYDVFTRCQKLLQLNTSIINDIQSKDQRALIISYLCGHYIPKDEAEATKLKHRTRGYIIIEGGMYKKGSHAIPHQVHHTKRRQTSTTRRPQGLLRVSHWSQSSSSEAIRQRFFWSGIIKDAHNVTQTYKVYQKFSSKKERSLPIDKVDSTNMVSISMGHQHCQTTSNSPRKPNALVAVGYFTMWMKENTPTNITSKIVQKIFLQNIICSFGVPLEIIIDNNK